MKTSRIIILPIILLALSLAGCGGGSSDGGSSGGGSSGGGGAGVGLLKNGVLQVGMEIGYPPFELFADDGVTPMGLDVDLGVAIAEEIGVSAEFIDTAWDGIFAGLDVDKYDVVISAVTITAERAQSMDFSDPYIENWQSIVVKVGNDPVTSVEGLEGLRVGYQGETTSDEYLGDMIDSGVVSCITNSYDKVINCFEDLKLGRLDAVISDSVVSEGYVLREPEIFEITWHQSNVSGDEPERFGVVIKKGNDKLRGAVNEALKTLENNGRLDEIRNNWMQ